MFWRGRFAGICEHLRLRGCETFRQIRTTSARRRSRQAPPTANVPIPARGMGTSGAGGGGRIPQGHFLAGARAPTRLRQRFRQASPTANSPRLPTTGEPEAIGAGGGGRTRTVLPPGDFKSPASAGSATPARARDAEHHTTGAGKSQRRPRSEERGRRCMGVWRLTSQSRRGIRRIPRAGWPPGWQIPSYCAAAGPARAPGAS